MIKQLQLKITGQVQGVFFRAQSKTLADHLHLKGTAKNNPDGSVTIIIQGPEEDLYKFIDWCWDGPTSAHVDNIEETHQEPQEFEDFSILH